MRVLTTRRAPHGAATARDELRLCLPWPRTGSMEQVERMTAFCLLADLTHGTNGRPLLADFRLTHCNVVVQRSESAEKAADGKNRP